MGPDLSVGSVLALGGVICGIVLRALMLFMPLWIAIALAILLGLVIGVVTGIFNGVVITRFKIPSLIVTLGQGYLVGAPNVVYVTVVLGIAAHIVLTQSCSSATFRAGASTEALGRVGLDVSSREVASLYK
jgi:ribose/xylose/arabinose/galactoside ABC-type transport system permease subunit